MPVSSTRLMTSRVKFALSTLAIPFTRWYATGILKSGPATRKTNAFLATSGWGTSRLAFCNEFLIVTKPTKDLFSLSQQISFRMAISSETRATCNGCFFSAWYEIDFSRKISRELLLTPGDPSIEVYQYWRVRFDGKFSLKKCRKNS